MASLFFSGCYNLKPFLCEIKHPLLIVSNQVQKIISIQRFEGFLCLVLVLFGRLSRSLGIRELVAFLYLLF